MFHQLRVDRYCNTNNLDAVYLKAILICLVILSINQTAIAAIEYSGDVGQIGPNHPETWGYLTDVYIGKDKTAILEVNAGSQITSDYSSIGRDYSSTGTVIINGIGSKWYNRYLYVGRYGTGTLTVTDGGEVISNGAKISNEDSSMGTVTIDGIGSKWNVDGSVAFGNGTMTIDNGGQVYHSTANLGSSTNSISAVNVNGAGSIFTNKYGIKVGVYGNGTLTITNGGQVIGEFGGTIGSTLSGKGLVIIDGAGSKWTTNKYYFRVGYEGTGKLNITNGGQVIGEYGSDIGYKTGSTGTVTVSGTGSKWVNNGSKNYIGKNGSGILNIIDGGLVSVAGTLIVDYNGDGDSIINMATGGMLALKGNGSDSLSDFLSLIGGTGAIRYWDDFSQTWKIIEEAYTDYELIYIDAESELNGYTVLTVSEFVPYFDPDIDKNGTIDMADFALLSANWNQNGTIAGRADIDGSDLVDIEDLRILLANWL